MEFSEEEEEEEEEEEGNDDKTPNPERSSIVGPSKGTEPNHFVSMEKIELNHCIIAASKLTASQLKLTSTKLKPPLPPPPSSPCNMNAENIT